MKLFKRIMLAALALCMALGIVGIVTACGKSKPKTVDYSVTVTCDEADVLTSVKVALTKESGEAVTGGEAKSLTEGKATFTLEEGTYKVVLSGYPETYEYAAATVSKASPNATVALTKKTVEPPKVTIDDEYNGTWSNADHTVVVDAANGTITLDDEVATDIAEDETAGYTFKCGGKDWSLYFGLADGKLYLSDGEDDFTELKAGTYTPPAPVTMPADFPATWYDETDEVAITFDGETFTYMDGEGVIAQAQELGGDWYFMGTYTAEDVSTHDFTLTWTVEDGTLTLAVLDEEGEELMSETFYAEPQGGDVGGGDVDITDNLNGTYQNEDKTYTVVVDAANDTITINDVEVTNLKEADFGYDFDWDGKSWNLWGLAGSLTLDGTGDNADVSISLYLVEEESTVDVTEKFDGSWYDEKFLKGEIEVADYIVDIDATKDTIELDKSSVTDLAEDEASGGYTFTFDNEQYKIYFLGDDDTTLYIAKDNDTPTALHKKGWKPQGTDVTMPADFPTEWESSDHTEVLTFNGANFTYAVDSETLEGAVTAVTDNKDGTYTLEATYNGGYPVTFTYNSTAHTLKVPSGYWDYTTDFQVKDPNQIDPAYDGTWANKDYTVVVDIDANTITINDVAATNIAKDAMTGYNFSWDGYECSLYFPLTDSTHETVFFSYGMSSVILTKGPYTPPQQVTPPEGMPLKWEMDMYGSMVSLILDEQGNITGDVGEGFLSTKTLKDDGNWYFNATLDDDYIFVWETEKNLLHMTYDGDITSEEKFTFTPVEEISLPEGLEGTYYDCSGMQETLTIKGTTVTLADSEGEAYLEYTITECTEDGKLTLSVTIEDEEGGDPITTTVPCAFDLEAGTFSYVVDPDSGEASLVYYKTLLHAESYPEGFTTYEWSNSDFGQELLLTFKQDSCDFTYNGKEGYLYLVEDDYLYAICDGDLLYFKWISADNTLTLDPDGFFPIEFTPVKAEFDSTEFLALELDGMWYADAYVGNTQQIPIYLNFTKDTTTVKFALNGQNYAEGEVTAYDDATKTITAVIGGDTYYFVYDPATTRITDGNPEGVDSTKNYGPYIHYAFDFDSTSIEAPEWFGFTFAGGETTLSIDGNYLIVNGESRNRIRHYDATKKELIVLFEGAHVFVTYDDGANTLTATPLKDESKISGSFSKVPDPLDPDLAWLDENAWETEEGGSISFEGANVTVNATGINNWKGYITAHAEEDKTLTVYFIGHGTTTITYTDEAVRTLTCTLGGRSLTFTQTVVLTLPETINGKWMGSGDWTSVTIEDGKMTVESGRFDKGPYDITNVANEGNSWTFKVTVASSEQSFTYDEGEDTLTVAIYNGVVTFKRYEEPKEGLPAALQNTTWKGANDAGLSFFNVEFGTTLTIKYGSDTTNADVAATKEVEVTIDTEKSTGGVWVFSFSEGDLFKTTYTFTYTTETDKLEMMKGTSVHFNFTKQGGGETPDLTKPPKELQNTTWNGIGTVTTSQTKYFLNITFTDSQEILYSTQEGQDPTTKVTVEITYDNGIWSFTFSTGSSFMQKTYTFTYDEATQTLTAKQGSVSYTFTKAE